MAEMKPIPEIIASKGLAAGRTGAWRGIPFIWADQLYGDPPKAFAKYLFTYTNAAQWSRWDEWGDGFVSEVIEPVYFQTANDISWNIYWVSVLNEAELRQIDIQQRISFSSNTEYTRNLLIPLEHLANSIPIGRIAADTIGGEMALPSDDWMTQLDAEDLGFCLNEYTAKNLDAYLEGGNREQKIAVPPAEESKGRRLMKLESIFVPKSFRAHYYPKDWTIPFRNVNLLYGPNGSGKTSLLSAIELTVTGQVRNLTEEAEQSASTQEATVLTVKMGQEAVDLHPPQTSAVKKERERQLYKSRSAKRLGPQLQSLFHRFNYLSADEALLKKKRRTANNADLMVEINGIISEYVQIEQAAEGITPSRQFDISRIDFDFLRREFARAKKKNLIMKDLQDLVCDRLNDMLLPSREPEPPESPTYFPPSRYQLPDGSTTSDTAPSLISLRANQKADGMNGQFHKSVKSCGMKPTSATAYITDRPRYLSSAKSGSISRKRNGGR